MLPPAAEGFPALSKAGVGIRLRVPHNGSWPIQDSEVSACPFNCSASLQTTNNNSRPANAKNYGRVWLFSWNTVIKQKAWRYKPLLPCFCT